MKLPEVTALVGTIEGSRVIYIEDYALQYLKALRKEEGMGEDKFVLYGRRGRDADKEVYIIYGICSQEEWQYGRGEEGRRYEWIGSLGRKGRNEEGEPGRMELFGKEGDRRSLDGYYIFYDADDGMKERLGKYYEKSLNRSRGQQTMGKKAELVALSSEEQTERASPYIWIRIAVTAILIIFCAIAVTTVNKYDKINDFVQAAVHTGEMMEESAEMNERTGEMAETKKN